MQYEEGETRLWHAGEIVPMGTYVRVDDLSYRVLTLEREGRLPASFDGHVAEYRAVAKVETLKPRTSK